MKALARSPRSTSAGFSLAEMLVVALILSLTLGVLMMIGLSSERAYETGATAAQLEQQAARAIDRVVGELRIAVRDSIAPDPIQGVGSSSLQYVQAVGYDGGQVEWTTLRQLAFAYEVGEVDDGLDNNGNGLIDEGRIVLTEDLGGPDQRQLVVSRWVPELFEGELPNGVDDNGNGLVDERGFFVERIDQTLVVRLMLQRSDAQGHLLSRTARTSAQLRN